MNRLLRTTKASQRIATLTPKRNLLDPCDELSTARMAVVDDQAGPVPRDFSKRKLDRFRIELGVVEKGQLAEPPENAIAMGEQAGEPARRRQMQEARRTPARVEDDRVERVERCRAPRRVIPRRRFDNVPCAHVEQRALPGESRAQLGELGLGRFRRYQPALVVL